MSALECRLDVEFENVAHTATTKGRGAQRRLCR